MDLFKDIIPSILQTKKCVINDDIDQKDYVPFVVNRALSYHMDCILYANEMNLNSGLDKDMQYQYLLNSVRPMKRKFQPWQKSKVIDDLDCIKEYFGYSNNKAKDALRILSEDQLIEIRLKTHKGGVNK
jgi:hypothetical protein